MTYNLHPLFVHFPIALLFLYSIVKIVPGDRWFPRVAWKHIERALLLVGVCGAFLALSTGETAEHLVRPNHQLVEMHSLFATISTWLYGALLAGEFLSIVNPMILPKIRSSVVVKILALIEKILTHKAFSKILALFGLVAISVTGLLGGVMVYGVSADPIAGTVLTLLGISL